MYYPMSLWTLKGFARSHKAGKKYDAILNNKLTGMVTRVPFGDASYQQYKDSTGLGLYSHKDHHDAKRRSLYRQRHDKDLKAGNYSAGYFSYKYLW